MFRVADNCMGYVLSKFRNIFLFDNFCRFRQQVSHSLNRILIGSC